MRGDRHPGATFNAVTGSALLTYDPGQTSRKEFLQQALPLGACLLEWEARRAGLPYGPVMPHGGKVTTYEATACSLPSSPQKAAAHPLRPNTMK